MSSIAIIIPCYNEGNRLPVRGFVDFLKERPSWEFIFVNDGSSDNTAGLIADMQQELPAQVTGIHLGTNGGKAAAVREGILHCLKRSDRHPGPDLQSQPAPHSEPVRQSVSDAQPAFIGYLDADGSAGPEEMERIYQTAIDNQLDYAFGSRIKKLNASIRRSTGRHLAGRLIATFTDGWFRLGIYDTQCGCKLFRAGLAETITARPFTTRWLFDMEIFLRIRQFAPASRGEEIPLRAWDSRQGSKIGPPDALSITAELIRLFRNYPRKQNPK